MEVILITHIIVLYNQKLIDSVSFKVLMDNGCNILVIDNSVKKDILNFNNTFCLNQNIIYKSMGGNKGLAKAYNQGIKLAKKSEWIVIWDQDTNVSINALKAIKLEAEKDKADIIISTIIASDNIVSPSRRIGPIISIYKDKGHITAINSGMAIKVSALMSTSLYNEEMFLDYIDHDFMIEASLKGLKIKYLKDNIIFQNLSTFDEQSKESALTRFKIYKKDFRIFCNKFKFGYIYFLIKILFRAFKLALKYRDLSFLMR